MLRLQAQRIPIENDFHIKSVFIAGANYERKKKVRGDLHSRNMKKKSHFMNKKGKTRNFFFLPTRVWFALQWRPSIVMGITICDPK